jgi:hypothetical protein
MNLGEQFGFCLVSFFSEVADQIKRVRAFAAHYFWQLILLNHLQKIKHEINFQKM